MNEGIIFVPDNVSISVNTDSAQPFLGESQQDDIILQEARPNPQLTQELQETTVFENSSNITLADLEILKKYSSSFIEPPMGVHNSWECPHCIDNSK